MSRLYVQNLPIYVDNEKLKVHFEKQGQVTDVCVIKTAEGKSRKFGFVGYRSEQMAKRAQRFFHGTFMDTCKIAVSMAKPRESDALDRPWSRYAKGSSRFDGKVEEKAVENSLEENSLEKKEDTTFEEFQQAVLPRSQAKFWANDDAINPNATKEVESKTRREKTEDEALPCTSEEDVQSQEENGEKVEISDMDFLKSKMKNARAATPQRATEPEEEMVKDLMDSNRLFVRNLPYGAQEEEVLAVFEKFGQVEEMHLPLDDSKRQKGFGYVSFKTPEQAAKALKKLDNSAFQGRLLHVLPSKAKKVQDDVVTEGMSFKEKKEVERRKQSQQKVGWNASYIRSDATIDSLAARYGVNKGDILDKETGNMAVRMAIGETLIVKENKEYLLENGIDLDALESATTKGANNKGAKIERSNSTLLIKNLPHSSDENELMQMFAKHGDIGRFIYPPSKTLAVIEFLEPTEARKAFRALAYKKYQHMPLYLEWAPVKVFCKSIEQTPSKTDSASSTMPNPVEANNIEQRGTVFVKNLNFDTTESSLQNAFSSIGGVRKATIARKPGKNGTGVLSMGYGFVEFDTNALANKAVQLCQSKRLDGHALELKISQKKLTPVPKVSAIAARTKIAVRNIAFEATLKEIRELFSAFGQLKCVRLPKKFDGSHRGFAFVEFLIEQEAKNAFSSLSSSHLYGRHLVLEWTKDENSIETLRQKASRDLSTIEDSKRTKKQKQESNDDMEF